LLYNERNLNKNGIDQKRIQLLKLKFIIFMFVFSSTVNIIKISFKENRFINIIILFVEIVFTFDFIVGEVQKMKNQLFFLQQSIIQLRTQVRTR